MKYKNILISIFIYFCITYFINVMTLIKGANLSECFMILFLNFRQFSEFSLEKFDPRLIIMFLLFLYILCMRMLSVVHENASFKSMYLNKYSKKQILYHILDENIKRFIITYVFILSTVILIYVISKLSIDKQDLFTLLVFLIYLFRLLFIIFFLNIQYTVYAISNFKLNLLPMIFIGLTLTVVIDLIFESSLITFSGLIYNEMIYMIIEIMIMTIAYLYVKKVFMKKEDLFND